MRCPKCGGCFSPDQFTGGICDGCVADAAGGGWTLPEDEWEEMAADERRAARKAGIRPEMPQLNEDVREEIRQLMEGGPG